MTPDAVLGEPVGFVPQALKCSQLPEEWQDNMKKMKCCIIRLQIPVLEGQPFSSALQFLCMGSKDRYRLYCSPRFGLCLR